MGTDPDGIGPAGDAGERALWLEGLLTRTDIGVYCVTADLASVLFANPAMGTIFGRPLEELRQNPGLWLDQIDPRDRSHIGDPLTDLRQKGAARHIYRVLRPDGATLWVLDQSRRVDDGRGRPLRFDCLFTDITRRMEVEAALKDSEERFRRLAETVPVAIAVLGPDGGPLFANARASAVLGRPTERMAREAWLDVIHPDDRRRLQPAVTAQAECEGPFRVTRPDGEVRWLLGSWNLLRGDGGETRGVLAAAIDVTERWLADEARRVSESNLSALIESSDDLIFSLDLDLRFLTFNSAMAGYCRSVFGTALRPGLGLEEAFSAERAALWREMLARVIASGRMSLDIQSVNGRFLALALNPITADRVITGVSVFAKDIEERKQAELAWRTLPGIVMRAHEEERRAIARDLHDDVLQDLAGLKLLLQAPRVAAAPKDAPDPVLSRVDRVMQTVRGAALRLRPSLLDDLGLLAAIRSLTKQVAAQAGVEVFVSSESLGERLDPNVETAAFRIVQEAVVNACRHSGARAAYVRVAREPDALIVSVRDEGQGFDVGSARYRAEEAGHFGLSAMEERANALRGTCRIRSAPGRGTEVLARIPLSRPPVS